MRKNKTQKGQVQYLPLVSCTVVSAAQMLSGESKNGEVDYEGNGK
jgi:hypothetical protein